MPAGNLLKLENVGDHVGDLLPGEHHGTGLGHGPLDLSEERTDREPCPTLDEIAPRERAGIINTGQRLAVALRAELTVDGVAAPRPVAVYTPSHTDRGDPACPAVATAPGVRAASIRTQLAVRARAGLITGKKLIQPVPALPSPFSHGILT